LLRSFTPSCLAARTDRVRACRPRNGNLSLSLSLSPPPNRRSAPAATAAAPRFDKSGGRLSPRDVKPRTRDVKAPLGKREGGWAAPRSPTALLCHLLRSATSTSPRRPPRRLLLVLLQANLPFLYHLLLPRTVAISTAQRTSLTDPVPPTRRQLVRSGGLPSLMSPACASSTPYKPAPVRLPRLCRRSRIEKLAEAGGSVHTLVVRGGKPFAAELKTRYATLG
jgi:hypothetical protein